MSVIYAKIRGRAGILLDAHHDITNVQCSTKIFRLTPRDLIIRYYVSLASCLPFYHGTIGVYVL